MPSRSSLQTLAEQPLKRTLFWQGGKSIARGTVLCEAESLAAVLPERGHVLNLCRSRYAFTVAFLAALWRGQTTVLPGDRTPRALALLAERYEGLYVLGDETETLDSLEILTVAPALVSDRSPGPLPAPSDEHPAAIAFTSGSTGEPVPNVKTLRTLAATGLFIGERFGLDRDPQAAILATVPSQHMYGLEMTLTVPLWAGAGVHSGRPLYPADIARALAELPAPRILVTTPIHLKALSKANADLPEVRAIISATAPLGADEAAALEQRYQTEVLEIYGFSEAGTVATRRTVEGAWWRCCQGLEIIETAGGFCVDAAHFPAAVPMTDDIDHRSAETFALLGRSSDSIKVAGKRASLSGLNAILNEIDGVTDGTFFQENQSEDATSARLTAFVVASALTKEAITKELRRAIDPAFLPRRLYFVPSLPRNETGKLTRKALAALAQQLRGEA